MGNVRIGKFDIDETQLKIQHEKAVQRGKEALARRPKAVSARYDKTLKRLVLEMQTGATLMLPVHIIQGLQTDDDRALGDFDLVSEGTQIHWHDLDVQFYVEDLFKGTFGTPRWMNLLEEQLMQKVKKDQSPTRRVA